MEINIIQTDPGSKLKLEFQDKFGVLEITRFVKVCIHYLDLYLNSKFEYPDVRLGR